MSKTAGLIGKIVDRATPQIVRGSDAFLVTEISYKGDTAPYQFANLAGATAFFPSDGDGVPVASVGAVVHANRGTIRFDLSDVDTDGLKVGESLSFEQHFEDDRGLTIIVFADKLDVVDSLFPA